MESENWLKEIPITVDNLLQRKTVDIGVIRIAGDEDEQEEVFIDPENYYSKAFLASQSSIFIRKTKRFLNKILWRVVYKNVLELIPIETDNLNVFSGINLCVSFPSSIKPYGIAFMDEEDTDEFRIHVLTYKNIFYTLRFTSEHFYKQNIFSEKNISDWCHALDGKLKVWSLNRRVLLKTYNAWSDQKVFDPQPRCLISILEKPSFSGHKFYLLTFTSLIESGFILWGAIHSETEFAGMVSLTSHEHLQMRLRPPTNNSVWVVLKFILSGKPIKNDNFQENTKSGLVIWVLWKSNTSSIIQYITIDPFNPRLTNEEWNTLIPTHKFLSKKISPSITFETSPYDVSEYWYRQISTPGQFSSVTIRTALEIYQYKNRPKNCTYDNHINVFFSSLLEMKESVYKEINTIVTLQRDLYTGLLLFDKYRHELNAEWVRFLRLCTELEELGSEPLDLIYDSINNFIFIIKANSIGIISKCVSSEVIHYHCLNKRRDNPRFQNWYSSKGNPIYSHIGNDSRRFDIAQLFFISNKLLDEFSDIQILFVKQVLEEEVKQKHSFSISDKIWILSDRIFGQHVESSKIDDINLVFNDISDPMFSMTILLQCLINDKCFQLNIYTKKKSELSLNMTTLSIYQVIHIYYDILLRMLLVLIFVGCYNNNMQKLVGFYKLFNDYLSEFRECCCIQECCSHLLDKTDDILISNSIHNQYHSIKTIEKRTIERLFGFESALRLFLREFYVFRELESNETVKITTRSSCILGIFKDGYEMSFCVAALLFQFKYLLEAMEIASWISFMPLGIYLKARIFLSLGKSEKSSVLFKKASISICTYITHANDIILNVLKDLGFSFISNDLYLYFIHVADVYYQNALYFYSAEFYEEARRIGLEKLNDVEKENFYSKMFQIYMAAKMYDNAYLTLLQFQSYEKKCDSLYKLVDMMCGENLSEKLCEYSFLDLSDEFDSILYFRAQNMIDVRTSPCYHKILYSWRIKQGNFQGAASIMYHRLQKLKSSSLIKSAGNQEQIDIIEGYLALLSALSCVDISNSWILYPDIKLTSHSNKKVKHSCSDEVKQREILDIATIRKEYIQELKHLPENNIQNTSSSEEKTCLSKSIGNDSHPHRQIKVHKTFVVHGRHHARVPSYGRNLSRMNKNTVPLTSAVLDVPDESKTQKILTNTVRKNILQMEIDDTDDETVQEAKEFTETTKNDEEHQEEQLKCDKLQVPGKTFEETEKNNISCFNIEICPVENVVCEKNVKRVVSSPSKPITSRLMSIRNHQVAIPYLTRETAIAKNTTQSVLLKENDSSYAFQHFNETSNILPEQITSKSETNALKSVVSDPSFKNYTNRTQQKLLLQRESSLTCIKSHPDNSSDNHEFVQRQIDYINKEYANISRFLNPSKHVILKLFHDGCFEGIKQTSNSVNHKSSEDKSNKHSSKLSNFIGKHDHHVKEPNKLEIKHEDTIASIQMILEKMWTNNECIT
ncbi:hypothetical protein PORY_001485 [Pneumocystis oryctolagi]|uniref:Uncharacterized protein n=1 Tax=Pneumocystis oryctolagi TaxID=42067 RepID=A0ACB7CCU2_9ASCO|nr:hypothetical protein PORY_001485 [Pneumocystis oryctolagi]